ncbi:uncharacterized protein LOC128133058 [Lactuca sativa]|uniref:C2H2-type domain-containing protein n=1 Tax=Lactuca sativa TaxID=4236 RepID=A0A9R1XJF2_LACSA|nr:uncharacterized protein LOC128133058 [Lactuca sativa]KAJ0214959.1 hypothetical protein LSAT_V11C300138000 [Lactuca sativa]
MKQDHEQKIHVCRYCEQSFSNGKKLGGHMRGHLALISASRKKGTRENDQEAINREKGVHIFDDDADDDDHVIKKSKCFDQDYHPNGRKQGIQEHDRKVINVGKRLDEEDSELIKMSHQRLGFYEAYDANGRKHGIQEHDHEVVNGDKCLDFDDDNDENRSQQTIDFDQDYGANVYVLRENPKRSWRVSSSNSNPNSSKAFASHKRCHSRKESIKNTVCEKCGKGFDSVKALYGHMRCHSIKRSQPLDESSAFSSSDEHEHDDDEEVANPVRKKRSCTRYKSPKPNHISTSFSFSNDDEVVEAALNLMMLSRGVRSLDGVKSVISHGYSRTLEKTVGVDFLDDGSMEFCKFKSNSELGLRKDLVVGSGSGQDNTGRFGSTLVKSKSIGQDFTDSEMSIELKRKSKDYKCPICFKGYVSIQGLAKHERVHNKTESKVIESDFIPDIHRLVDINLKEVSQAQCRY